MEIKIDENELYIEPISACNLRCKLCYSNVINGEEANVLPKEKIINVVQKFSDFKKSRIDIYWCGTGEIFLHKDFPSIVNHLNSVIKSGINHTVMTNGTIDRLDEFNQFNNISFRVSIDGPREHHEWNRGKGTYDKCIDFCKKAHKLGCKKIEIRTLVTKDNVLLLPDFENELKEKVSKDIRFELITPYSSSDLKTVKSRFVKGGIEDDKRILSRDELKRIIKSRYGEKYPNILEDRPDIVLSICLTCQGVFSCCEGIFKIGDIETEMSVLYDDLLKSKDKCKLCPLYGKCD